MEFYNGIQKFEGLDLKLNTKVIVAIKTTKMLNLDDFIVETSEF